MQNKSACSLASSLCLSYAYFMNIRIFQSSQWRGADAKEKLKKGMKVGSKTFRVYLDGSNITDTRAGKD
ncbi:MAG TPA: hypothetical protein VJM47_09905 [Nitrosospira sp.]|nr:hypothetical protein [Nitrosospira sp.]